MNEKEKFEFYVQRVAHFLKGMRSRKNLTQTQMARMIRVSISTISRLESNKLDSLNLEALIRLSILADMSLSSFFLYLENNSGLNLAQLPPWQRDILESLSRMKTRSRLLFNKNFLQGCSEKKQDLIIDFIEELTKYDESSLNRMLILFQELKKGLNRL